MTPLIERKRYNLDRNILQKRKDKVQFAIIDLMDTLEDMKALQDNFKEKYGWFIDEGDQVISSKDTEELRGNVQALYLEKVKPFTSKRLPYIRHEYSRRGGSRNKDLG